MPDELDATREGIARMMATLDPKDLRGMSLDDLGDAMAHPKAAEVVAQLMPVEAASVQQGDPAPDFRLPYLRGSGPAGATLRLSDHFGVRPVALVFGSYT